MMKVGVPYEVRLALLQQEYGTTRDRVKEIALGKRLAHAIVPGLVLVLSLGAGACALHPRYEAQPLKQYTPAVQPSSSDQPDQLPQPWAGPKPAVEPKPPAAPKPRTFMGWGNAALDLHAWRPKPHLPYWLTLEWASQMHSRPDCTCRRRASRGRVVVRCVCTAERSELAKR